MGDRFGIYELVRRIGQGGMAEIFLARFCGVQGFERWLVIKRMLPELAVRKEFVGMFLDEAKLAARFNHPNIVQVHELGEQGGTYFMAMEYVDGPHLGALFAHSLRIKKPLPIPLCCYVVARAAEGLHHAHELTDPSGNPLGIVHRDVSPQNVLVSRQGDVKILDFGVAKATTQSSETRTGVVKGKISYMSPEQCLAMPVDRRTDVFGLGIVLHELCTRRRLFRDKNDLLVMQRITTQDIPPPSSINPRIPPELDAIVMGALQRDVEQRTADALTLSDQLDAYLASLVEPPTRSTLARWVVENAAELTINADQFATATPSWQAQATQSPSLSRSLVTASQPPTLPRPDTAAPDTHDDADTFDHERDTPVTRTLGASTLPRWVLPAAGGAVFLLAVVMTWMVASSGTSAAGPSDADAQVAGINDGGADESNRLAGASALSGDGPAAPLATTAALRLATEPPGAEVFVNGADVGRTGATPLLIKDLPTDKPAKVVVNLEGHDTVKLDVPLAPGEVNTLPIIKLVKRLAAEPLPGVFDITSRPSNLKVTVDGLGVGRTPLVGLQLREGSHSVLVDPPPGYLAARDSIRSRPGVRVPLHFELHAAPRGGERKNSERKSTAERKPVEAAEGPRTGKLVVDSTPWTNVYLGKKLLGPTPVSAEVPAGKVVVRLARSAEGCVIDTTRTLDVQPGGETRKGFKLEARELKGTCQ